MFSKERELCGLEESLKYVQELVTMSSVSAGMRGLGVDVQLVPLEWRAAGAWSQQPAGPSPLRRAPSQSW